MVTPRLPAHGTVKRYRIELKDKSVCDKCRAANTRARAKDRANLKARIARSQMSIVPDPQEDPTPDPTAGDHKGLSDPEPGPMEKAVCEDLEEISDAERVPMHNVLTVMAIELAKDFDKATISSARTNAQRQLFEVVKSLRMRREGDGSTALDGYLEGFGSGPPELPGRSA